VSNENPLSGRRVLIVEDEMIVSWALADMLGRIGCVVVGRAARVSQALAMIEASDIDVALLDVNLNGVESFPVAAALAARRVPFVFSTGYRNESLPDDYKNLPMLQKPFSDSMLTKMLAKVLLASRPEVCASRQLLRHWR
jgi:two-component SAPR family response regulator